MGIKIKVESKGENVCMVYLPRQMTQYVNGKNNNVFIKNNNYMYM